MLCSNGYLGMFSTTLKEFTGSESGAISLDFVLLTSLVLSFGVTVTVLVAAGVNPVTSGISAVLILTNEFSAKFVSVED